MKKVLSGLIAALAALLLASCAGTAGAPDTGAALTFASKKSSNLYVWEKPGVGGDFTITLNADGTYSYYAGPVSSYIGAGTWTVDRGVLTMTEDKEFCGNDNVFLFRIDDESLRYIADGSSKFMYVNVRDGDRFLKRDGDSGVELKIS